MFIIKLNNFISNLSSNKYIENMIKILKCPILESNSEPLDPKSDTLPVELPTPRSF